ncbi:MAG: hypothetical protein J3Q66DRAFT_361099 [Benniella sp.]|nr:MAG: hypothetical protein J3Q66DRAFT_361099 [Benniella sp.]
MWATGVPLVLTLRLTFHDHAGLMSLCVSGETVRLVEQDGVCAIPTGLPGEPCCLHLASGRRWRHRGTKGNIALPLQAVGITCRFPLSRVAAFGWKAILGRGA